ncbi:unnamed protein product, partial [Brachionus calyciflorus]
MNRIKNIINEYYDLLTNQIDILTEEKLSKKPSYEEIVRTNNTRSNFLSSLKESRIRSYDILQNNFLEYKDDESIRRKVFENNFCFVVPLKEKSNFTINSILVLLDWYLSNEEIKNLEELLNKNQTNQIAEPINLTKEFILFDQLSFELKKILIDSINASESDGIISFKKQDLFSVTRLDLTEKSIESITIKNGSPFNQLIELLELDLSSNYIAKLENNAFDNLNKLEKLSLDTNQIKIVEPKAFDDLTNLTILDLADNQIFSFDSNCFNNLKNLRELTMSENNLVQIQKELFRNFQNLEQLDISFN